jgi:hypothetical protein
MDNWFTGEDRGQGYITEALIAILLLSSILLSVSSTIGVVESSLSTDEKVKMQSMESDLQAVVEQTQSTGALKSSLLNWNSSDHRYDDYSTVQSKEGYYYGYPADSFGSALESFANRHPETQVAVEIVPAKAPLQNTGSGPASREPNGTTVITTGSTTETVIVTETYMTVYADDTLRSPPAVYGKSQGTTTPFSNRTTVATAYDRAEAAETTGDTDSIYFPFTPKTSNDEAIADDEVWNTYRVRVIAWF